MKTAVTATALAVAVVSAAVPASAASHPMTGTSAPAGIGFGNTLNQNAATMYSAPQVGSYVVGIAHRGDNLADLCTTTGPGGMAWDLVLERNGWAGDHVADTAAFIPKSVLSSSAQQLNCLATGETLPGLGDLPQVDPVSGTRMTSAPDPGTYYVGTENAVPVRSGIPYPMVGICVTFGSDGEPWAMVLDFSGAARDHLPFTAAFIPAGDVLDELGPFISNDC